MTAFSIKPFNFIPRAIISLAIAFSIDAIGQSYPGPQPLLSPSIYSSIVHHVATQVNDSSVKYGFNEASFGIKFPLYIGKDWLSAGGNIPFCAVLFNAQSAVKQTNGKFFYNTKQLLKSQVGVTALRASGLKNLYMISFQTRIMEDLDDIRLTRLKFSGNAFWRHRNNDQFNYTLGLSYSHVYGRNIFLPIIGLGYHFTKEDVVNLVLPFNVYYTHNFGRRVSVSAFIKPQGGSCYLQYDMSDSIKIADVLFRERSFQGGVSVRYSTYRQLILIPEIGITSKTRLALNNYKTSSQPSVYAKLSVRYRFGKRATAAPILNFDPGDMGIEQNDYREE